MSDKIEFNLENLKSLCALNCTHEEIASYFNVSTKTVQRRIQEEPDFSGTYEPLSVCIDVEKLF